MTCRFCLLGGEGGMGELTPLAKNLLLPHTWKSSPNQILFLPHQKSIRLFKWTFSSYNLMKTSFLAVVIAPVPFFVLISHSFETQAMLILILIDVKYSHNAVFSFEKAWKCQNHCSSGSHHLVKKKSPQQCSILFDTKSEILFKF